MVEYSTGSGWTALSISTTSGNSLVDGTSRLRQDGTITWNLKSFKYLWKTQEVNSEEMYWIRISLVVTLGTDLVTSPTAYAIGNHGVDRIAVFAQSGDVNPFFKLDTMGRVGFLPPELTTDYKLGTLSGLTTSKFEVVAESGMQSDFIYYLSSDGVGEHPAIIFAKSRGTVAAKTLVSNGDDLGGVYGFGYDGTRFRESTKILFEVDAVSGASDMPGRISFWTTADGASVASERMRINSAGRTGFLNTNPQYTVDINGNFHTTGVAVIDGSIVLRNQKISGLLTPTDSSDAVNKWYADQFIKNVSLGSDFFWQGGLLEVSINSVLSPGKNLTLDVSGNIAVVNSPNFTEDVSIQTNLFVDQKIQLKDYTLSNSSTGDLWWDEPRLLFKDGSTNRDILQGSLKGNIYPASPSEGDIFYRTDNGLQFVYDGSRGKYLSTTRQSLSGGRTTAVFGSTVYLRVGDATQSSTSGFKMFRNGTITAFSVDNNNTLTAARTLEIRVNDSVVASSIIGIGAKSTYTDQANADFNAGDIIQVSALAGVSGSELANWIVVIEIAYRA